MCWVKPGFGWFSRPHETGPRMPRGGPESRRKRFLYWSAAVAAGVALTAVPAQPSLASADTPPPGDQAEIVAQSVRAPTLHITFSDPTFSNKWQPLAFEVGPASLRPSFRLICDACPGVNNAFHYIFHSPATPRVTVMQAVLVDAGSLVLMFTQGGQVNLFELNF
jgi:hypothetical protein